MNGLRTIFLFVKKCKSLIKYIIVKEIINIKPEDANSYLEKNAPPLDSTPVTQHFIKDIEVDLMIIVPAYNSEKWIEECVNSIISQKTEYSFRVVFIDDGSTDDTGKILDKYIKYDMVKVIHQKNKGYSGARNTALKMINSKYIMFVDSDDYLLPNAIQCLLDLAIKKDIDIVEGNGYRFNELGRLGKIKITKRFKKENICWGAPWMKVMKASLWENFEFPEGYLYEDTIIGTLIFPLAKTVCFVEDEIYAYRIHEDSITQKHDKNLRRVDSYWIMLLMTKLQEQYNISRDYESYKSVMMHIVFTYRRTVLLPEEIKKSIFIGTSDFLMNNYSEFLEYKNRYYLLSKAFKEKDFAKYVVYCQELAF